MDACEKKSEEKIKGNREIIKDRIEELECNAEKIKDYLNIDLDRDLKGKQKCSDEWITCLKKREERKNKVQKEMNSAFIPCVVQKKAAEFHDCLKCYRRTNACVLQKKQEVYLANSRKKIVEKQFALVNEDLNQASAFLKDFDKIVKKNASLTEAANKDNLINKSKLILSNIEDPKCILSCTDDSSDYKEEIECIKKKWKDDNKREGMEFPFNPDEKKELENFIKAYKRITDDFSDFSKLAIDRCDILRDYDREGAELLDLLEQKISTSNDIEKSKFKFELTAKEYDKFVSNAQKNYKKAMTLFSQIVKTPKLNCLQKHCITLENNKHACWKSNLESEKKCNSYWRKLNNCRFSIQKRFVEDKKDDNELVNEHKKPKSILTTDCCKNTPALDTWEASIPDYLWENLIKYEEARYLLSQVASIFYKKCKIKSKRDAMEDALADWVNAFIDKSKKNNHHNHLMQHAYELLKEQVAYAEKNNTDRIQITIRGDASSFISQYLYIIFQDIKKIISLINADGANDNKKCRKTSTPHASSYDTDPYNLPSTELCELSALDLSNKLPKPCSPRTPPCMKENKSCIKPEPKYRNDDEGYYPCTYDPKCPDETVRPARQNTDLADQAGPSCDCG